MAFRAAVSRAVAREKAEGTRCPTLAQLLQPKAQRTLAPDVEAWLAHHELGAMLESLAVHLLRTLPVDEYDEVSSWADTQRGRSGGKVKPMELEDVSERCPLAAPSPVATSGETDDDSAQQGYTMESGTWSGRPVLLVTVSSEGAAGTRRMRAAHYKVACSSAVAPSLVGLQHEALLPTYGYATTTTSCTTIHPLMDTTLRTWARRQTTRMEATTVVQLGLDVISGIGHLHTLGILHRNLTADDVFVVEADDGGRPRAVVGGYTYAIRTSRGRIASSGWLPAVSAPELLHSRVFDWATDAYSVGVTLIDLCQYGAGAKSALQVAQRHAPASSSSSGPAFIPGIVWRTVIAPLVAPTPEGRSGLQPVRRAADAALADGGMVSGLVPLPSDTIDSASLTAMSAVGIPATVSKDAEVVVTDLAPTGWPSLLRNLRANEQLTSLRLTNTVGVTEVAGDDRPVRGLQELHLERCALAAGSSWTAVLAQLVDEKLEVFDVRHVPFGDVHAADVVRWLAAKCPKLRTLHLQAVGGDRALLKALAAAAPDGAFGDVDTLSLRGNAFPAAPFADLCAYWLKRGQLVGQPSRLANVDFGDSRLDYFSIGNLAQVIAQTVTLDNVVLTGVELSGAARRVLDNAVQSNTLRHVSVVT